jgi:tetratricopeptide (TPR) repeat protein
MPKFFTVRLCGAVIAAAAYLQMVAAQEAVSDKSLASAERLFLEGKYAEAQETFRALPSDDSGRVAVGIARCQEAAGQRDKAAETLTEAALKHPNAAVLPAELARLAHQRGDHQAAALAAEAALKLDSDQVEAQWVRAEVLCDGGKLDEATTAYERLVQFYNDHEVKEPERLQWIGLAAAKYARWKRLPDQFHFLVNEFYRDILEAEPAFWQAHYEAGVLFAEKYNQGEASKHFKAALAANPNAAVVHAAVGRLALDEFDVKAAQAASDRALEINPQLLAAWHLKADVHLANFEPRQAIGVLNDALKLNAHSEETLGRLAAAYGSVDGLARTTAETRFGKLVEQASARNPHAGVFFETLADALDRLRRWPAAARYYEEAIARMPQLGAARGELGMTLMRLGEEPRAKQVLDEAFEADPFNVRVNNTLKVLEVLEGYETLETEHFRIRFNPQHDKIVAPYMAAWLEEVYPQLVKQMGFEPPEKSLFEIFSRAKNTDGHGWFSARMVGLPHIHPIGACAGKIVALQSPVDGQQRFNWGRVLKHEFIHVINLQQTDFNIPHWFTEALATLNEGYPRPQSWNDLLVESLARDKLFNLDSINFGFIRPHSSADWTLAYCQAELYAEYMIERFGDGSIAKMLAAYADNLTTAEALTRAFGVSQADFEQGYRKFVAKIVAQLPPAARDSEMSAGELQKALAKTPKDANLLAKLAQAQLGRRVYPEARRSADAALAIDPKNALAHYVRARLHLLVGENKEALQRLETALDRERPQENVLALLAGLKLKSEEFATAAELYELGARQDPGGVRWLKSLAAVYLKSSDDKKLTEVLTKLAEIDADDFAIRKKLAQLAIVAEDYPAAGRWSLEALRIDVRDVEVHAWRGEALMEQGSAAAAAQEYAVAVELEPDEPKWRLVLAQAYLKASDDQKAKTVLQELLKQEEDYPGARELLESIP